MANSSITKRGLLLYYSSLDEILKIDSAELGDLIKKEMEWMSGRNNDEPVFDDVRCDVFHMHLKEQIMVREIEKDKHKPKDNEEAGKQPIQEIEPNQDFDPQFSNPAVIEEPKQHKTKDNRTIEEKRADWKTAYDSGKDVYNYWKKLFNSEDEGRSYLGINRPKPQEYDFKTIDDAGQYLSDVWQKKNRNSYYGEMNYIAQQGQYPFEDLNNYMLSTYGYR